MTIEQAMQRLKEHKINFSHDHGWDETTIQALDIAIKSLAMWDKIIDDLKIDILGCDNRDYVDGITQAIISIKLYRKEIEE